MLIKLFINKTIPSCVLKKVFLKMLKINPEVLLNKLVDFCL